MSSEDEGLVYEINSCEDARRCRQKLVDGSSQLVIDQAFSSRHPPGSVLGTLEKADAMLSEIERMWQSDRQRQETLEQKTEADCDELRVSMTSLRESQKAERQARREERQARREDMGSFQLKTDRIQERLMDIGQAMPGYLALRMRVLDFFQRKMMASNGVVDTEAMIEDQDEGNHEPAQRTKKKHGDPKTDAYLYGSGQRTDKMTFLELYGVSYKLVQRHIYRKFVLAGVVIWSWGSKAGKSSTAREVNRS